MPAPLIARGAAAVAKRLMKKKGAKKKKKVLTKRNVNKILRETESPSKKLKRKKARLLGATTAAVGANAGVAVYQSKRQKAKRKASKKKATAKKKK